MTKACTGETCLKRTGGACPFYRVHQTAQSAHILIVNHALLLADVATGNRVLPEYDYLIVDEAHHLEDATTNALSYRVTQADVDRFLRELGGPRHGLLGWLLNATDGMLTPEDTAQLNHYVQQATDLAFRLEQLVRQFYLTLDQFLLEQREGRPVGAYAQQQRILPATRTQPAWADVELAWDEAQRTLQPLIEIAGKLSQGVAEIHEVLAEEHEELSGSLANLYRRMSEFQDQMNGLVFEPAEDRVYWAEANPTATA
jgi:ATP-dependent DNA helicase DinG